MTTPQGGMQSVPTVGRFQLLLVASSADGISGLGHLLGGLPAGFDVPVEIVQDPPSAEFSSMPDAALEAADADYVVPLPEIAPLVCRLVEEGGRDGRAS